MAYDTVTLSGTYKKLDGTAETGTVYITPTSSPMLDAEGDTILAGPISIALAAGAFSVALPATDDTALNPTGFGYTLVAALTGGTLAPVSFALPAATPTVNMADITSVDPSTFDPAATYASAAQGARADSAIQPPDAASWPLYLYGASYSTLSQAFHTAGGHWSEILADRLGAGAVTSYGVNGRRALDVAIALLSGDSTMAGITGVIPAAEWPGVSTRNGIVVHDALGNDAMNQAAMNGASVIVAAITGSTYLDYLEQTWRAALALMSTETRIENHTHATTSGTWTHSSAAAWASGGDTCFTTANGAYAEYSVTPPQRGPLAGKVFVIVDGDIPTSLFYATTAVSVDGGAATNHTPVRVTYTGQNGSTVKGVVAALPVTVPVDGNAHTIRVAHAGTAGHYLIIDALLVPSEDPNPILCMGIEHALTTHASGLDAGDVAILKANEAQVTAAYKAVVAEFSNAIYVPSTMTTGGLWSGDGIHPNDRGMAQRAADAETAITSGIRARLASRVLANTADGSFAIV